MLFDIGFVGFPKGKRKFSNEKYKGELRGLEFSSSSPSSRSSKERLTGPYECAPYSSCAERGASARHRQVPRRERKPAATRHARHAAAASLPRLDRVTACAHRNRPRQRRTGFRLSRRYRRPRRDIFQPPGRLRVADRSARVVVHTCSLPFAAVLTERTYTACNRCGRRPHGNGQLSPFAKRKGRQERPTDRPTIALEPKR